jgi:hypothetical protein
MQIRWRIFSIGSCQYLVCLLYGRTDGKTDGRMDKRTDGRTDGRMDGWTNGRKDDGLTDSGGVHCRLRIRTGI